MLFGLGLAVGVTIALTILTVVQSLSIARNQTEVENWVVGRAGDRPRSAPFRFPYNLGLWGNIGAFWEQCFSWEFDGLRWTVAEGCRDTSLAEEVAAQRQWRRDTATIKRAVREQAMTALVVGFRETLCSPGLGESKVLPLPGELVRVFSVSHGWAFGEIVSQVGPGAAIVPVKPARKGWFILNGFAVDVDDSSAPKDKRL